MLEIINWERREINLKLQFLIRSLKDSNTKTGI